MSDGLIFSTSVGFNKLKSIGQFQLTHLWKIRIFKPSGASNLISQDEIDEIIITARTLTGIPGYTRNKVKFRYMDREFTVPTGMTVTGDHEFSCDVLFDEYGRIYKNLFKWYKAIPHIISDMGLQYAKSNGVIFLYSIDGETIRRSYEVTGIYPLEVPEMTGWDQDSMDNHLKVSLKFAFDEIIPFNNIGSSLEGTKTV